METSALYVLALLVQIIFRATMQCIKNDITLKNVMNIQLGPAFFTVK